MIAAGDRLIVIAEDDDTIRIAHERGTASTTGAIVEPRAREVARRAHARARLELAGPAIIARARRVRAGGLDAHVVADLPPAASEALELGELAPEHDAHRRRRATRPSRTVLDSLDVGQYDHIIVLATPTSLDAQRADARTLITLLHLRDIASKRRHRPLDRRARCSTSATATLAEVTRADDFIVSDRLISLLLTQVSENKQLNAVFDDLFDAEGAEIYLRPAERLRRASARRSTSPPSSRRRAAAARSRSATGSATRSRTPRRPMASVNPRKSATITFADGDRVIVLAEDGDENEAVAA